jgi:hypothetical protein
MENKYDNHTGAATKRRLFSFRETPHEKETYGTEPVRIGNIIGPVQQLIDHPDRDRIMAVFFKDYK